MNIIISGYEVQIDDADYEIATMHKYRISNQQIAKQGQVYFRRDLWINKKYIATSLHRDIMGCAPYDGKCVDHINGDTLDNRKCNLRVCTKGENSRNRKLNKNNKYGHKGVSFDLKAGKWRAKIRFENKEINLGYYASKEDASRAYDAKAIELHGDFAYTNTKRSVL